MYRCTKWYTRAHHEEVLLTLTALCFSPSLQAESLDGALCVPDIKLHSNPSAFNVYCNVRHCVLDWQQREASLALASRSSVQSGDSDSEEEEEYREPAVKLPKV